jgi:uncharacterized protein with PQ loop repeat
VVQMLAWCGAALSCLLTLPQAVRVLRTERLDGISASTYVIVLGNAAVWATWAMCTGEHAAGVPALINGPAAILILRRLAIERRKSRILDAAAAAAGGELAQGLLQFPACQLPIGSSPVHEPQCQLVNHVVRVVWNTSDGWYSDFGEIALCRRR